MCPDVQINTSSFRIYIGCISLIRLSRCVIPTFLYRPSHEPQRRQQKSRLCWTCHTPLSPRNGVELHGGVSIEQLICQSCGRH
jgi:hypothetical protein